MTLIRRLPGVAGPRRPARTVNAGLDDFHPVGMDGESPKYAAPRRGLNLFAVWWLQICRAAGAGLGFVRKGTFCATLSKK